MIHIASEKQSNLDLINITLSNSLIKQLSGDVASNASIPCNCAFIGYAAWRQQDAAKANPSDEQVLVVRDGRVHFLKPRHLIEYDPDGVSWGNSGKGATQLASSMLAEIFSDWKRVRRLSERFRDEFIARIPQNTNWTVDGADVLAIALAIESESTGSHLSSNADVPRPSRLCRSYQKMVNSNLDEDVLNKDKQLFLRAVEVFKSAAIELEKAWDDFERDHPEDTPLVDNYPFERSFDEVAEEICEWSRSIQEWTKES